MTVSSDLFEVANNYLLGHVDLDALDMWLAKHAQELARLSDDNPMAHLAGLIQVTLAEMDDLVATEAELRSRMVEFFEEYARNFEPSTNSTDEPVGLFGGVHDFLERPAPATCRTYSSLSGMLVSSCSSST